MQSHVQASFCAMSPDVVRDQFTKFDPDVVARYGSTAVTLKAAIKRGEFPKLFRFAGILYSKNAHLAEYDARVAAVLDDVLA